MTLILVIFTMTSGCHRAPPPKDIELGRAKEIRDGIAEKLPLWDDDPISRYELGAIQKVKDDLLAVDKVTGRDAFIIAVHKLADDWEDLNDLDIMLGQKVII